MGHSRQAKQCFKYLQDFAAIRRWPHRTLMRFSATADAANTIISLFLQ